MGRITRYRGRRRRCRTGTGSHPPPVAALAAAGPLPRHSNRPSLLILGTHGLSVDRHARTFCRPGGVPSIHRAAAAQAIAENLVKLKKMKHLMTLMCHCHDSGSIYMGCKTLASSLVGMISARQLHHWHTRAHLSRRVAQGHL